MIPLGSGDIPSTGSEAAQRITGAIQGITTGNTMPPQVDCTMTSPSQIDRLVINITGMEAASSRTKPPASFTRLGDATLGEFQVLGDPADIYGAPVKINVHGHGIPVAWSRDDRGQLWLVPVEPADAENASASGNIEISAPAKDVEEAMRKVVSELAEANGARLKDLQLRVESAGPRALVVAVDVAAAKFMMTAKVRALAEASVDDEMNLRIGQVDVTGDGAAGAMVANLLTPKIAVWRGRQIALGQYMFAGAALRDVQLEVGQNFRLSAKFGR